MERLGKFAICAVALVLSTSAAIALATGTAEPEDCLKAVGVSALVSVLALIGIIP